MNDAAFSAISLIASLVIDGRDLMVSSSLLIKSLRVVSRSLSTLITSH